MKRSIAFWIFTLLMAWGATVLKAKPPSEQKGNFASELQHLPIVAVLPDPIRSTALSLGFVAIALTYRRAWQNWTVQKN
jgi:hypothetical protein